MQMLHDDFFDRDACLVARALVGKVLRRKLQGRWLAASVVEAEAYYKREKGSHASLGRTPSRESLFMSPGTIYMYYARGGDSLNICCRGAGNAVLIKSGLPYVDGTSPNSNLAFMQRLNPRGETERPIERLCSGQTILCKSLSVTVRRFDGQRFDADLFFVDDVGYRPNGLIQTRRLGIPEGRDEQLMYRFVDRERASSATQNPLTKRAYREGIDYLFVETPRE